MQRLAYKNNHVSVSLRFNTNAYFKCTMCCTCNCRPKAHVDVTVRSRLL